MEKVLLSVAPIVATPHRLDHDAIADDVLRCYEAGASMVHLHVRDAEARLTSDTSNLACLVAKIRARCDIVIEVSTGGVSGLTIEERCHACVPDFVEFNSLNVGSVNLGQAVYKNPINEVKYCVEQILKYERIPDTEIFELGMIETLKQLIEEYPFPDPLLVALVFGHPGEMPATKAALHHMLQFLDESLGCRLMEKAPALRHLSDSVERPESRRKVLWGYTQANRKDWDLMQYALEQGADALRVGFEDSNYLDTDLQVGRNAPLIEKAAACIRSVGKEPMTVEELRSIWGRGD
jgi:3-keto-5-aminohexanoate cleavage enzyme